MKFEILYILVSWIIFLYKLIKKYPVSRIELGIPTLDPAVLAACRREADPEKIFEDISLLMKDSLPVGVQMMIGLPGQRRESSLRDLTRLAELKGGERWELRLYPCLVIAGTELERLYRRGEYRPLSVEEYKRVQGFPDDWRICGNVADMYKQIGNAVPVALGEAIGRAIIGDMNGDEPDERFADFRHSRYRLTNDETWQAPVAR